ncbi:hypothetical protein [uncultured Ilyobacter sp.]|nr:hypothetical protein [uncultured Ilyobacter sp.]
MDIKFFTTPGTDTLILNACNKVLEEDGANALQYSTNDGCLYLREHFQGI